MSNIGSFIQKHGAFLLANSDAYEYIVKKIHKMDGSYRDDILNQVAFAAQFATRFHPGRFADGAIENLALDIGKTLEDLPEDETVLHKSNRRRILHVASKVQGIGGHSRTIYHWIKNDQSSYHSLLILNQENIPIPQWLSDTVRESGDLLILPQSHNICQKAQLLRKIARRSADLVVLHIDGNEVVPIAAFAVRECPPVSLVNHFDHHFWLGSSVTDIVIDLRKIGAEYTAERRFVPSNIVLPIPLVDQVKNIQRHDARCLLGIPEDQVVLISIGRAEKYWPYGPYDFVATAGKILDKNPTAHVYVVGESEAGISHRLRSEIHKRLHFVGIIEDPSLYRKAADVYLESFPYGTQTALLEAGLEGLPVVPAYDPLFPLLVSNDDALQDILSNAANEQDYIILAESLIKDPDKRIVQGNKLRERLLINHVGEGWLSRLATVYKKTDCLIHNPRHIPKGQFRPTSADIGLSMWHVIVDENIDNDDLTLLWHIAFLAEYVGDYSKAGWFTLRAILHYPRGSWRIFARVRSKIVKFLGKTKYK